MVTVAVVPYQDAAVVVVQLYVVVAAVQHVQLNLYALVPLSNLHDQVLLVVVVAVVTAH